MTDEIPVTRLLCGQDGQSWFSVYAGVLGTYGYCEQLFTGAAVVGAFAAALSAQQPYRVVCLGADLTDGSSLDTLRELRAVEARLGLVGRVATPVVLMAERQDLHHIFDCFRAQCEGYLVKPYQHDRLHRLMADLGIAPLSRP